MTLSRLIAAFALILLVAPPASAQALAGAAEKRFGTLGSLIDTTWSLGNLEIVEIKWDRPGEGIMIERRGLFGRSVSIVVPDGTGKGLRYAYRNSGSGIGDSRVVPLRAGSVVLESSARQALDCKIKKDTLQCKRSTAGRAAGSVVLGRITSAAATQKLAALPGEFPDMAPGSFDPELGVLAEIVNRPWLRDTNAMLAAALARSGSETTLVIDSGGGGQSHAGGTCCDDVTAVLERTSDGRFVGEVIDSSEWAPTRRSPAWLAVGPGGETSTCMTLHEFRDPRQRCDTWRLSRDGSTILRIRSDAPIETIKLLTPPPPTGSDVADHVIGRLYRNSDGEFESFAILSGTFLTISKHSPSARYEGVCTIGLKSPDVVCDRPGGGGSTYAGAPTISKGRLSAAGDTYILRNGQMFKRRGTAAELPLTPASWAEFRLIYQSEKDQARIETSSIIASNNRAMKREFWDGFANSLAGVNSDIASGRYSSNTWRAAPPGTFSPSGSLPSYQSVGGISYASSSATGLSRSLRPSAISWSAVKSDCVAAPPSP